MINRTSRQEDSWQNNCLLIDNIFKHLSSIESWEIPQKLLNALILRFKTKKKTILYMWRRVSIMLRFMSSMMQLSATTRLLAFWAWKKTKTRLFRSINSFKPPWNRQFQRSKKLKSSSIERSLFSLLLINLNPMKS
jgi:hypothetical protein